MVVVVVVVVFSLRKFKIKGTRTGNVIIRNDEDKWLLPLPLLLEQVIIIITRIIQIPNRQQLQQLTFQVKTTTSLKQMTRSMTMDKQKGQKETSPTNSI